VFDIILLVLAVTVTKVMVCLQHVIQDALAPAAGLTTLTVQAVGKAMYAVKRTPV